MKRLFPIAIASLALAAALTGCAASPKTSEPGYVGLDSAKHTALNASSLAASDVSFTTAELGERDGTAYYELDFTDGSQNYRYAVDAVTGAVIESSTSPLQANGDGLDEARAAEIALQHAGVTESDTSYLLVRPDFEDGIQVYDVEFYVPSAAREYDYEIDASTGEIRSFDQDAEGYAPQPSAGSGTSAGTAAIGEDKARQIALDHAGVAEADTGYLSVKLDFDDGVQVYDVEFYVPATASEYDYEIDAATGEIRSFDQDAEGWQPGTGGTAKTEQEIRDIALAKVPGATSQEIRLSLDQDDGKLLYEGKIVHDGMEYEFEIDAYSGAILEWEADSVFD